MSWKRVTVEIGNHEKLDLCSHVGRVDRILPAVLAAIAQSDERTERRVAKLDEQLASLRDAIQANSQALGSLTREAETRSALAA